MAGAVQGKKYLDANVKFIFLYNHGRTSASNMHGLPRYYSLVRAIEDDITQVCVVE